MNKVKVQKWKIKSKNPLLSAISGSLLLTTISEDPSLTTKELKIILVRKNILMKQIPATGSSSFKGFSWMSFEQGNFILKLGL